MSPATQSSAPLIAQGHSQHPAWKSAACENQRGFARDGQADRNQLCRKWCGIEQCHTSKQSITNAKLAEDAASFSKVTGGKMAFRNQHFAWW